MKQNLPNTCNSYQKVTDNINLSLIFYLDIYEWISEVIGKNVDCNNIDNESKTLSWCMGYHFSHVAYCVISDRLIQVCFVFLVH